MARISPIAASQLVALAELFHRNAEAPSEDDVSSLFHLLVARDFEALCALLARCGVDDDAIRAVLA